MRDTHDQYATHLAVQNCSKHWVPTEATDWITTTVEAATHATQHTRRCISFSFALLLPNFCKSLHNAQRTTIVNNAI